MIHILEEKQRDRDEELSALTGVPVEQIELIGIASPDALRVYNGSGKPDDIVSLYREYKHLNLIGYLRTLMATSVLRRHVNLISMLKTTREKTCLDFGAGVGTHTIALMQGGNNVAMLDVDGPLREFALKRIRRRFGEHPGQLIAAYTHDIDIPHDVYDIVVCADVLEHVPDPRRELVRIWRAMKAGALIYLEVSTMVKPSSGHFEESIRRWTTDGARFLRDKFDPVRPTIYRKK